MKVAITAVGDNLDAEVDPRFGRCNRFLIVDLRDLSYEVLPNTAQYEGHGAGISAAQTIIGKGVGAVIAGSFGPNAFRMFDAAHIPMYTFRGKVSAAVQKLRNNQLTPIPSPTDGSHSGLVSGYGAGQGAGRGAGQGAGRGAGRGMGRGGGQGMGSGGGRRRF